MIYFISDVHLSDQRPRLNALFFHTLEKCLNERISAIYFLGDIFEYWLGPDLLPSFWPTLIEHCQALHAHGIKMFFVPGNRDFLFASAEANLLHWQILSDPYCFEHQGQKILLTHGDSLLGHDKAYTRYRAFSHQSWVKRLFLALPLRIRQSIAQSLRKASKTQYLKNPSQYREKADISKNEAKKLIQEYKADILIHGHVHYHAVHQYHAPLAQHWILADWSDTEGSILVLENQQLYLTISK